MNRHLQAILDRLQPLRPYFPHLAALLAAMSLGIAVAVLKASAEPKAVEAVDRWPFPQWTPYRAGDQRKAMASRALWVADPSRAKAAPVQKVTVPPWRFIGTLQDGKTRLAVIELDQGKRVQRVASGATLPNGATITRIESNELGYNEDGAEKVLRLFGADKSSGLAGEHGKN